MNTYVYYHSSTGNTKKVAQEIAKAAGCEALSVDDASPPDAADLLFLGGAVYANEGENVHHTLRAFIEKLDPAKVKRAALFRTGFSDKAISAMRTQLSAKGIAVVPESFGCKGRFLAINRSHPGDQDLAEARAFADRILNPSGGQS